MGYSNEEIVKGIYERRSKVLLFLYDEYFKLIKRFILRNHGTEEEAEDVFQDTILIVYEKIKSDKLKLSSSFMTYFYAICRNLWLQRLQVLQRTQSEDQFADSWNEIPSPEEYMDYEEEKLFQYHFSKLDKDCQHVLTSYFERKPFRDIANELRFSPSYIKKLKYKCKEKLYMRIVNDPVYKELMTARLNLQLNQNITKPGHNGADVEPDNHTFTKSHANKQRNE